MCDVQRLEGVGIPLVDCPITMQPILLKSKKKEAYTLECQEHDDLKSEASKRSHNPGLRHVQENQFLQPNLNQKIAMMHDGNSH